MYHVCWLNSCLFLRSVEVGGGGGDNSGREVGFPYPTENVNMV